MTKLKSLDELQQHQRPLLSREERLLRWHDLLQQEHASSWFNAIRGIERTWHWRRLRCDHSPLALAADDPILRAAGLNGDTLGDAEKFFGLDREALHLILCWCHGSGASPRTFAHRILRVVMYPPPPRPVF